MLLVFVYCFPVLSSFVFYPYSRYFYIFSVYSPSFCSLYQIYSFLSITSSNPHDLCQIFFSFCYSINPLRNSIHFFAFSDSIKLQSLFQVDYLFCCINSFFHRKINLEVDIYSTSPSIIVRYVFFSKLCYSFFTKSSFILSFQSKVVNFI